MKKTILLLPLLLSVNAFAFENPCAAGNCTMEQIQAYNKANYKTIHQMIKDGEDWEAEAYRRWVIQHDEDQARADALPKYVYKAKPRYTTCVQDVYEKATAILGDDATRHIDVSTITLDKCRFEVKEFGGFGRACDNLAALAGIAEMGFYQEEQCRFEGELYKVYLEYEDILYTPSWSTAIDLEYRNKLRPIYIKHNEIVLKLQKQEKSLNK